MIRTVKTSEITENIKEMCIEANYYLSDDVRNTLYHAKKSETWPLAENILEQMGLQIKYARLRRKISAELVAERAGISRGFSWSGR